jgi:hypothetical protein
MQHVRLGQPVVWGPDAGATSDGIISGTVRDKGLGS